MCVCVCVCVRACVRACLSSVCLRVTSLSVLFDSTGTLCVCATSYVKLHCEHLSISRTF